VKFRCLSIASIAIKLSFLLLSYINTIQHNIIEISEAGFKRNFNTRDDMFCVFNCCCRTQSLVRAADKAGQETLVGQPFGNAGAIARQPRCIRTNLLLITTYIKNRIQQQPNRCFAFSLYQRLLNGTRRRFALVFVEEFLNVGRLFNARKTASHLLRARKKTN
jgi:hypothetical protein